MVRNRTPQTRRAEHVRTAAGLLFCAVLALLLSTCDFFTSDMFPSWLSFTDAVFDVGAEMLDFSGGAVSKPGEIYAEYLQTVGGDAYIAVLLFYNSTGRLVLLDPTDMSRLGAVNSNTFSPFLAAGSNGDIVCGGISIDPATVTYSSGPSSGLGYGNRQWLVRTGPATVQYIVGMDTTTSYVSRYGYNYDWSTSGSLSDASWSTPYPPQYYWDLLDADTAVTGTGANFLFSTSYFGDTQGYVSYFAATTSIYSASLDFMNTATEVTGPFPVDEGWAWVTSGGPVAFRRGDKDPDRLVRYKFGTGSITYDTVNYVYNYTYSTELDSIPFDSDDQRVLSFDPEGKYWFFYNRESGMLYKIRTWWK